MALSALSIAASGISAAQASLETSSHNIANVNTSGFKSQSSINKSLPSGGVQSFVRRVETPGDPQIDPLTGETIEGSNVNIVHEMVNLMLSLAAVKSNANTIRIHDEMTDVIVDMLA